MLPKGHIEPGESPQYAAVREVREETGCWARVEKWIEDVRFPSGAEIVNARFFGMELLKQDKWPPENRKHEWLLLAQALSRASHPETKRLLEGFRKSEATAKKEEKSASA